MIYKETFEDYLQELHMKENPCILDDELPDAYADWACELDIDTLINHAQKWHEEQITILKPKEGDNERD